MKEKLVALIAEAERALEDVTPHLENWGYDDISGEILESTLAEFLNGVKDALEENK